MHFPYPTRKSSHPTPYAVRSSRSTLLRQRSPKQLAAIAIGAIVGLWLLLKLFLGGSGDGYVPPGTPGAVVVTVLEPGLSESYKEAIKANRRDYASRHALRHAMTLYPHSPYLFYLTSTALIMSPSLSLEKHVMNPSRLESLMIVDQPVVPPDSVIKTFSHLKGSRIDFVLTQDKEGLAGGSMIVRNGDWAKFFLDAWFDPLYRSYNFQKAEGHALEHIVQWHGTILAKLALIPQRILNSYTTGSTEGVYQEGDFVANFHGCQRDPNRKCEEEMQPLLTRWRELVDRER
ncbi:putative alpha-1,6-mannosyltransferase mnn11 [Taxawa tesnikishii (nom. ined.)]|nr:putative alpha-1,6-mannosyltransferase mnn11 [Dothideales sp. JES 119]